MEYWAIGGGGSSLDTQEMHRAVASSKRKKKRGVINVHQDHAPAFFCQKTQHTNKEKQKVGETFLVNERNTNLYHAFCQHKNLQIKRRKKKPKPYQTLTTSWHVGRWVWDETKKERKKKKVKQNYCTKKEQKAPKHTKELQKNTVISRLCTSPSKTSCPPPPRQSPRLQLPAA